MKSRTKRKKFLINPAFQWSFIGFNLILSMTVLMVFWLLLNYFILRLTHSTIDLGLSANHGFIALLERETVIAHEAFAIAGLVLGGTIIGSGLYVSHRIAGPLYRLKMQMKQDGERGRLSKISFRKGDFFPEIADGYNEMMRKLDSGSSTAGNAPAQPGAAN